MAKVGRPSKNKDKENVENQNIDENKEVNEIKEEKPRLTKKRKVNRDDYVEIMNNTTGRVHYRSKRSGAEWNFYEYGATDEIEVAELITMKNSHARYLTEPWIIILDDDVVEFLGLKKLYENILKPNEIDNFFRLHQDKIKELLKKMPTGMKELIIDQARMRIKENSLTNLSIIRAIEDELKIELISR